ncbi:hypothetical protein [Actinocorallia populi]|uniref:hypothetical protein n=1 Tax=Actinocorallia populi TaxID=2079200 RepID=UPI000D09028A|nr:hypothetical protein [Actinocorallia populi]
MRTPVLDCTSLTDTPTLSWDVAASIPKLAGGHDLAITICQAFLYELSYSKELRNKTGGELPWYGIGTPVAQMLAWLIRHDPTTARLTVEQIIGETLRQLEISREVTERSIATALSLDGDFDKAVLKDFLNRVFTPKTTT